MNRDRDRDMDRNRVGSDKRTGIQTEAKTGTDTILGQGQRA